MDGLVIRNTGSWYLVRTEEGGDIECKIKGNFRLKEIKSTNPIAVGDRVSIIVNNEGVGLISEIKDRKNYIVRRSSNLSKQSHILGTNLDLGILLVTVSQPVTSTTFIDRFLASAEAFNIPMTIVFNKVDLCDEDEIEYMDALISMYDHIGYPCMKISALNNDGLSEIHDLLKDKITLFSGHSGVGKSTLINTLLPGANVKTGAISDYHGKGMHTTTFSEMLELPQGGYIIDTPGIKGFGVIDIKREELAHYFRDIFEFSHNCKFNNCIHINEPGCAVLDAVENHYISKSRYKSYLNIMEEGNEDKYRK